MDTKELKDFMIQERLSLYFRNNRENSNEENKKNDEFLKKITEMVPSLKNEYIEYMDWLTTHSSKDQIGIYLFGVHDGIHLMKEIMGLD